MREIRALHRSRARRRQRGAALLAAMLTVVLVSTFAASALWQQWRSAEIERAERARVQAAWLLVGALDWSRLILREDAIAGGADHLAEPWAVPLQEARLSDFLAAQNNVSTVADAALDVQDAFLSGQIIDLQSRMNLANLAAAAQGSQDGKNGTTDLLAFSRLFEQLGLPPQELRLFTDNLRRALDTESEDGPLMPQRLEQLAWFGLAPATLARLAPYVTLLPLTTPVNLNTAGAEVLQAVLPGGDRSAAQRLIAARQNSHFRTLADAEKVLGLQAPLAADRFGVASQFFEVRGRMRIDQTLVQERSLVQRQGQGQGVQVRTVWRERASLPPVEAAADDAAR